MGLNNQPVALLGILCAILMAQSAELPLPGNSSVPPPAAGAGTEKASTPPAPELRVSPRRVFGAGRADAAADAINPPDGLAFTRSGLLVATDAMSHRVQVFDPRTGRHLGHAGDTNTLAGQIVNVISLPDDRLLATDETARQVYLFEHDPRATSGYRPALQPLFKGDGFARPTGLACDSKKRIYVVEGVHGEVRRYLPDFKPDPGWKFKIPPPPLNHSEGIAIDEKGGVLFVTSEWEGVIHAFDLETGAWLGKSVGRRTDPLTGQPLGPSVFQKSVEGLAVMGDYLLAVDEGCDDSAAGRTGHLLIFDLRSPALYATGADECQKRAAAGAPAGLVGWLGSYRSPDGVAAFPGDGAAEALIAVADQGAYRVLVYSWNEVLKALR